MYAIEVKNLYKKFKFTVRDENRSWISNFIKPQHKEAVAVNGVSFNIKHGERVAFIGPNGAGKSTTIKMLTGILFNTSGDIKVLGMQPNIKRKQLAYKIGTVFGQRSQLFPNLTIIDSMKFYGKMYNLSDKIIYTRIKELVEIFDMNNYKDKIVRKLSLGERMKAEVAVALMHKPDIILLDEPTIGLDIVAKKSLRETLLKLNIEQGTTIFLTSHDVGDIENLCERTIIINHGEVVADMSTNELSRNYISEKYVDIIREDNNDYITNNAIKLVSDKNSKVTYEVDLSLIKLDEAVNMIFKNHTVVDINIYNMPLEEVIRSIYAQPKV